MTYKEAVKIANKFNDKHKVETFEEMAEFIADFRRFVEAMRVISRKEHHGDDNITIANELLIIAKLEEVEKLLVECDPYLR